MGRLDSKVVIVTGAAGGMGKADAELLVKEGARVVLTDIDGELGRQTAANIDGDVMFIEHNVADEGQWQNVIAKTLDKYGKLDGLVNNAGILTMSNIEQATLEHWRKVQAVNVEGVFLGCKYGVQAMRQSGGGGSIVNMSSIAAMQGPSYLIAYSASKGAVRSLTKSVAMHCKESKLGIRCNSIHPDGVRTNMVLKMQVEGTNRSIDDVKMPPGVRFEPEDIGWIVVFLLTDESRFINGAEILADDCTSITPPQAPDME